MSEDQPSNRIERGIVSQIHIATDRGALPKPNEQPAVAITNGGLYLHTTDRDEWVPLAQGSVEDPIPTGFYEDLSAASMNGTVFASESIASLPSIHDAVGELSSDSVWDIRIVGGENRVTEPIQIPQFGDGVDIRPYASLATASNSYIKQANGANLDAVVRTEGAPAAIDVTIDGNGGANNSTVTGVWWANEQGGSAVRANLYDCDRGLAIVGNTETSQFDVYVNSCGVGIEELKYDGYTPDENSINLRGHTNDGPFYRKTGSGTATDLRIDVETCPGDAVVHDASGNLQLRGIIRNAGRHGVYVSEGDVVLSGATIVSCEGSGVTFDGGRGRVSDVSCNNMARGIVVGGSTSSHFVKIAYPSIINVTDCAVEFREGRGNSLVDPQSLERGSDTGHAIRLATGGRTSAYIELNNNHVDKAIHVGEADSSVEVKWNGQLDSSQIDAIPTAVEGMWGYNSDAGSLCVYDGGSWRSVETTQLDEFATNE
jgi:hypothetical protein